MRGPTKSGRGQSISFMQGPWALLLVSGLLIFCCAKFFSALNTQGATPNIVPALKSSDLIGQKFQSCDVASSINFYSKDECTILKSGKRITAKYTLLTGPGTDPGAFLHGYLHRTELWYRYDGTAIVGKDKLALYNPDAPEAAVLRKMWWYSNFAQKYYQESRRYPADADQCRRTEPNFGYVNPVTGKHDSASIILDKQTDEPIDLIDRGSYDRHWRPGAIICLCSNYRKFLVEGFDRSGRPLISSDPSRYFAIISEYGKTITTLDPLAGIEENAANEKGAEPSVQIYVYDNPDIETTITGERRLIEILLWTIFCFTGIVCYAAHKSKFTGAARASSIAAVFVALFCVAAWYFNAY